MNPPKARRIPHPHRLHGDERPDDYYWLRDRDDPEVIRYLEEENRYHEHVMRPLQPFADTLYREMADRVPEAESDPPARDGEYYYYSRMEKNLQYPVYARKRAETRGRLPDAPEEVVLDLNGLVEEGGYLSVTVQRVSPDHTRLAYLENRDGSDRYTLCVKDLSTGATLPDRVQGVFIDNSLEWDSAGEHLFYITVDETQRPNRLWRRRAGEEGSGALLYEETDPTFSLSLGKSRSGRYLFLKSGSKETDEIRILPSDRPLDPLRVFDPRRRGIQYDVEHWGDDFLVLTNDGAKNFRLQRCPVSDLSPGARKDLFPPDESRYLQEVHPFRDGLAIAGRQDGLTQVWTFREGKLSRLLWDEPLYTVSVRGNRSYDTSEVLVQYESLLTPRTTYGLDLRDGGRTLLQEDPVAGPYERGEYRQERLWATAGDGVKVPMAAVYRAGLFEKGPAPLILSGYGSYGLSSDPRFDPFRLPLLDRGVALVTAQVRGGAEMGRTWYEDGKLLKKPNTFTDFIAAARDLVDRGYTAPDRLAARGASAGGLLMGAVANMAGDLFQVIAPGVPFVDVVTTMLDASIPLTSLEWDEWGNPADPEYYACMKSYSPYDNVGAKDYPHLYITTGLNDPRVAYWEPAKWTAKLRAVSTGGGVLVLRVNMGAGHFGSSGRFNRLKELADMHAFVLDKIGLDKIEASAAREQTGAADPGAR